MRNTPRHSGWRDVCAAGARLLGNISAALSRSKAYLDVISHRNCVRRAYLSCASKREDPSVRSKDLIAAVLDHRGNTTD